MRVVAADRDVVADRDASSLPIGSRCVVAADRIEIRRRRRPWMPIAKSLGCSGVLSGEVIESPPARSDQFSCLGAIQTLQRTVVLVIYSI